MEKHNHKVFPNDQGAGRAAMYIKDNHIVIDFGKEVAWLAFGKPEIRRLIEQLQELEKELNNGNN